jgi:hypothetical protein
MHRTILLFMFDDVGLYFLTYVDSFLVDVVEVVSLIDWLQVEQSVLF